MNQVSVVMPVYNGSFHLEEALQTVFDQTEPADEIVAVDDGSTDSSGKILERHADRVSIIRTPNRGLAAARNAGIERARGPWIAFLDQDDRWMPTKLASFFDVASETPEVDFMFSDAITVSPEGRRLRRVCCDPGPGDLFLNLLVQNRVISSTVVFRKDLWARVGPFRDGFCHPSAMVDWDFFLRAATSGTAVYLSVPLTEYRVHAGSSLRARLDQVAEDQRRVVSIHAADSRVDENIRRVAETNASLEIGTRFLAAGDALMARREFWAAARCKRWRTRAMFCWASTFLPTRCIAWGKFIRGQLLSAGCRFGRETALGLTRRNFRPPV